MDQESKVDGDLRNALFERLGVTDSVTEQIHIDDTKAEEVENKVTQDTTTEKKSGKIKDLGFSALAEVLENEIDRADKTAAPLDENRGRCNKKIDSKLLEDLIKGFRT